MHIYACCTCIEIQVYVCVFARCSWQRRKELGLYIYMHVYLYVDLHVYACVRVQMYVHV